MYVVDERDRVVPYADIPAHSPGAPMPVVFADDHRLMLAYLVTPTDQGRVIVEFVGPRAHYFGPPNDEALAGHPLYARGLESYGVYEIRDSSWVRALEQRNRVHPQHDPRNYDGLRHLVLTFHDSTFECIAMGARIEARFPEAADRNPLLEIARRL